MFEAWGNGNQALCAFHILNREVQEETSKSRNIEERWEKRAVPLLKVDKHDVVIDE